MVEVESVMKWGLISAVTGFGLYTVYKFMQSQGWISPPTTVGKIGEKSKEGPIFKGSMSEINRQRAEFNADRAIFQYVVPSQQLADLTIYETALPEGTYG